jgi:acyl carrier protein
MDNIHNRVVALIQQICQPEIPKFSNPDGPLVGTEFDSLDYASLLMAVEDEFGVTIGEDDVTEVGTLNGLVNFVKAKVG